MGRGAGPRFLQSRGLLARSNFYLSEYLERNRPEYCERLLAISRDGDWTGWCVFFLTALTEQAKVNQTRVRDILELYRVRKDWIATATHSQHSVRALDWMFQLLIFSASDFRDAAGIPGATATRNLCICRDQGLLKELRTASGRRPAILCFPELLNIAEGRDSF